MPVYKDATTNLICSPLFQILQKIQGRLTEARLAKTVVKL